MPDRSYRPKQGGRYGLQVVTAQFTLPGTTFTQNATVTHQIPTPPGKLKFLRASVVQTTIAAGGTLTFRFIKRRAVDNVDVAQTATQNAESTAFTASERLVMEGNATEPDRTFLGNSPNGDTLELDAVADNVVVTQQPAGYVVVEFAVLE